MSQRVLTFVLLALLAVGILLTLATNPLSILIPVAVIGGIFFLAKRQPRSRRNPPRNSRWNKGTQATARKADGSHSSKSGWFKTGSPATKSSSAATKSSGWGRRSLSRKKKHPFQVIEGYKGKKPPQDEPDQHQYH